LFFVGEGTTGFAVVVARWANQNRRTRIPAVALHPVATGNEIGDAELPETLNAVIWVRQGRERLALANISGAMMIQATVPAGLGVLFTPWRFDRPLIVAVATTFSAVSALWIMFRSGKVSGANLVPIGLLYVMFAAAVVIIESRHL